MTFKQAYEYAMAHSDRFRRFDAKVKKAMASTDEWPNCTTPCLLFSPGAGEVFYYGFDGVDLHKGKHTPRRAKYLLDRDEVFVIQ